jgi:serine/threonine-protein kinase
MQAGALVSGRYEILRPIAEGGMGAVYEARHVLSRQRVALKVLHAQAAHDELSRARFLREVAAPAEIGHPGVCAVSDAGFDEGTGALFVVMELLEGETLRARMDRGLAIDAGLALMEQLLEPLAAAHAKGFVHRDLKPENAFIARSPLGGEMLKLLDFGIARQFDDASTTTRTGVAIGTPHYMAPEQATDTKNVRAQADVWAVGVMLFELLAGRLPFDGDTSAGIVVNACMKAHPPLGTLRPGLPDALVALVDRCLAKDPQQRPADAAALARALREARGLATSETAGSATSWASTPPSGERASSPSRSAPAGSDLARTAPLANLAQSSVTPGTMVLSDPGARSSGAPQTVSLGAPASPSRGRGPLLGIAAGAALLLVALAVAGVVLLGPSEEGGDAGSRAASGPGAEEETPAWLAEESQPTPPAATDPATGAAQTGPTATGSTATGAAATGTEAQAAPAQTLGAPEPASPQPASQGDGAFGRVMTPEMAEEIRQQAAAARSAPAASAAPAATPALHVTPSAPGRELTADEIRAVVNRERGTVQRCYETAVLRNRERSRLRIDVDVTIAGSGAVTRATAQGGSRDSLHECVEASVRRWRFPPTGTQSEARIPFIFQASDERPAGTGTGAYAGGAPAAPAASQGEGRDGSGSDATASSGPNNLPARPSRGDLASALHGVAGAVRACGEGNTGMVAQVRVVFGSSGHVTSAQVLATELPPSVRSCIERAVRGAAVPPFSEPSFTVNYPFPL